MKQSDRYIKWFSRAITCILLVLLGYAATRSEYNSAHWVPHSLLRKFGAPYELVLYAEQNIDAALHFFGAAALVFALWFSKLPLLPKSSSKTAYLIALLCVGAESFQLLVGRGWQSSDLLLGMLGCFMAYLMISKNKQTSINH